MEALFGLLTADWFSAEIPLADWRLFAYCLFFFFSSRRRHTRFDCDWSSDVCSSDLRTPLTLLLGPIEDLLNDHTLDEEKQAKATVAYRNAHRMQKLVNLLLDYSKIEIGRASCRERV